MRQRGGRGKQYFWRRRGDDCRSDLSKNGFGRKKSARNGNFVDFARVVTLFSFIRGKRDVRFFGANPYGVGGNGRRNDRGEIAGKITDKNGEPRLYVFAIFRRCIFVLFALMVGDVS